MTASVAALLSWSSHGAVLRRRVYRKRHTRFTYYRDYLLFRPPIADIRPGRRYATVGM